MTRSTENDISDLGDMRVPVTSTASGIGYEAAWRNPVRLAQNHFYGE